MPRKGFTYIELFVVIGIVALLTSMFFSAYRTFSRRQLLKKETYRFVEMLDGARKRASSRLAFCPTYNGEYKVTWTTGGYFLTPAGCSVQPTYALPPLITIDANGFVIYNAIGLNGPAECVILRDTTSSQCRKVTISAGGTTDEQIEADCACP